MYTILLSDLLTCYRLWCTITTCSIYSWTTIIRWRTINYSGIGDSTLVSTSLSHPHCHCHLCNRSCSIHYHTRQVTTSNGEWVTSICTSDISGRSIRDIEGVNEVRRISIFCGDKRELHGGVCIRTIYLRVWSIITSLLHELSH